MTINGENLDFTDSVTFGGTKAPIIDKTRTSVVVKTLPHTAGNVGIVLFDIDNAVSGGITLPGGFRYDPSPVTEFRTTGIYFVGPGEGVDALANSISISQTISCITNTTVIVVTANRPPELAPGIVAFRANGGYDCRGCLCSAQNPPCPTERGGTIAFTLVNTSASGDTRLRLRVSRSVSVPFNLPRLPPLPPTECGRSF